MLLFTIPVIVLWLAVYLLEKYNPDLWFGDSNSLLSDIAGATYTLAIIATDLLFAFALFS